MNQTYRLRYANQIVGVFLLVVLVASIALSLVLLRAGDYLVEQDSFWVELAQDEIGDLHQGADVMILGQRAGNVDKIEYVDGSTQIRVSLSIDPDKSNQIFENSVVSLARKFGVGTPVLVIRRAVNPQGELVQLLSGSQIKGFQGTPDRIDQMSREVEAVSESIRLIQQTLAPTLVSMDSAAKRMEKTLDEAADPTLAQAGDASQSVYTTSEAVRPETLKTLQTMQSATENLESRITALTTTVEKLVKTDVKQTLADVRDSTEKIDKATLSVQQTAVETNENIAATLLRLQAAAVEVQQLARESRQLVRVVRSEADELPGTTERVNDTVSETQDLVGEIRSHWLLRRYSNQGSPTRQVSPASVRGGMQ